MGFGDFIDNLEGLFSSDVSPTQSAKDAGTRGDQDRTKAHNQGTSLAQGFHGEYMPEGVAAMMENFETMSHDRIIQFGNAVVPNDLTDSAASWQKLADDTHTKTVAFQGAIESLLNEGWSGASADAAKASVRKYVDDVDSLKNAASIVASKISDAAATLTQVKGQIPDKPQSKHNSILGIVTDTVANAALPGAGIASFGGQLMADHGRASNAEAAARDVMNNVYKKYLPEADTNVPKMPGVTDAPTTPGGASGPVGPSQSYGPSTYVSTSHSYGPSTSNDLTGASGPTSPSDSTSASTSPSSLNLPDAKTGSSFAPTGLSGPSTSGLSGTNTATAGYSPSGFGTAGTTGGGGFGGGLGGGSAGGGPGGSVPGGAAAAKAAGTPIAGITGAGNTGMGGGMMGGQGAKKDKGEDDGEHKSPEWLKGIQEELIGPEPKLLPGGVIGGDYADN